MQQSDRAPNLWVADDVVVPDDVYIGVNVVLHAGVRLGPGCHLEDGAVLGKRARMGRGSVSPAPPAALTVLGEGTVIGTYAVVCAGATTGPDVFLGDHSLTREGAVVGAGASLGRCGTVGRDARLGERVRTQGYVGLATDVVVENDVFLGPAVCLMAGFTMRQGETSYVSNPCILRRGSRIGGGAQVLPGVEIGEEAVVGANAVVAEDVPAGARVRGIPAR